MRKGCCKRNGMHTGCDAASSNFGDVSMFFQHTRMEADLNFRPEWFQAAQNIFNKQSAMSPMYTYPDLPAQPTN